MALQFLTIWSPVKFIIFPATRHVFGISIDLNNYLESVRGRRERRCAGEVWNLHCVDGEFGQVPDHGGCVSVACLCCHSEWSISGFRPRCF